MSFKSIMVEQNNGVTKITLNQPDNANTIDMTMGKELMEISIQCGESSETRAVLLTGSGRMFCAGGDLRSLALAGDQMVPILLELTTYLHAAISRFARMNAPLVIAVNGMAAGAGMSIACAGDYVLAAESARFTMAYTKAGLSPNASSTYYLTRAVGVRRAKELMLTNRILNAAEALEWGMINQVCADNKLMETTETLTESFAAGPTMAFGAVKKLLLESATESLETQMEKEAQAIVKMARGDDAKEGIAAFLEKRKPTFQGK